MGVDTELFLLVRNATNEAFRLHTSFLKDEAPQPGRSAVLGLRARF
jgi:iron complex outermembrane receptor protein